MEMMFGLDERLRSWLEEDVGSGDVTADIFLPEGNGKAVIAGLNANGGVAYAKAVICMQSVFDRVHNNVSTCNDQVIVCGNPMLVFSLYV